METKKEFDNVSLSRKQVKALFQMMEVAMNKVTIRGHHQVGKADTVKRMISVYKEMHPESRIIVCAPTEMAAKKASKLYNVKCDVTHRIFGTGFENGNFTFKRNKGNPIEADLIIFTEVFVLSGEVAENYIDAIGEKSLMIVLDDVDKKSSHTESIPGLIPFIALND